MNDINTERNIRLHKQSVLYGKAEVLKKKGKVASFPLIVPIYPYLLPVTATYLRNALGRKSLGQLIRHSLIRKKGTPQSARLGATSGGA